MPLRLIGLSFVLVTGLVLSGAAPAMAQSAEEIAAARGHFERGQTLAEGGRWREAYVEFQAGFGLTERPAFLFNMAECVRQLGDAARARELYTRYLTADPNGPLAEQARARLQALPAPAPVVTQPPTATPPTPIASREPARPNVPLIPTDERDRDENSDGSLFTRWPFWAGVGVVVAGGVVTALLLSSGGNDEFSCGAGCVDLR